jgi:hypothetical protein
MGERMDEPGIFPELCKGRRPPHSRLAEHPMDHVVSHAARRANDRTEPRDEALGAAFACLSEEREVLRARDGLGATLDG